MSQSSDSSLSESIPDKVVLVGDVGVGKTSLFVRFETGKFKESTSHDPRKGEVRKEWNVDNSTVAMTLFDTAGIERHMSTIPPTYFRWSKVVVLVYSIDDSDTFDSLTSWCDNAVSARVGGDSILVLVGNKSDMTGMRKVEKGRAFQYASNNDISEDMVFEVSAKTGDGVQAMFDAVALKMGPKSQHPPQIVMERRKKPDCCK